MFKPTTFGKYYLTDRLAVGGMAEIYKAKLLGVGGFERPMVVKQILPQLARNPAFVDMFIDEARIAVSLAHGNIVQVYELGRIDGIYFIAMEYVDGRDLADILDAAYGEQRLLSWELASFVAIEILHGLDYAHRRRDDSGKPLGIVHRDISPQNILISFEGEVKITDFGIAKAVHKVAETQVGVIKGKFGYMSPEQALGQEVDARTDIFSVGVLLYEMVTGRRLFQGKSDAESIEKVRAAKVPTPSLMREGIPAGLDPIIFRALTRERRDRYPDASSFQLDLSRFLFAQGSGGTPQQLGAYLRALFGQPKRLRSEEIAPAVELAPKITTRITAETDALIDDLVRGAQPPPTVSTQILNAQTDALMGELGIGREPVETPLPPPPEKPLQWSAAGRPIERPEPPPGQPTVPVAAVGAIGSTGAGASVGAREGRRSDPNAPEQLMRELPTSRERPEHRLPIPGLLDPTGASTSVSTHPVAPARGAHSIYVLTVVVLVALLGVVLWRTELLTGGWRARKEAAAKARVETQIAARRKANPPLRYGTVEIGADTENAKVFLHAGAAPVEVPHLDTGLTQELRVEHDAFWPQMVLVPPSTWQGGPTADVQVTLVPTGLKQPAEPKAPIGESSADKYGALHVSVKPASAEVWLLVGFTPTMHMEGLRADRDYKFKVVAEHHLPQVVELKRGDWKDDGVHLAFRADLTLPEDPNNPIPVIHVKKKPKPKTHTVRF